MTAPDPIRIIFVCWGNICRSPMAERIAQGRAEREHLSGVEFSSAGVSSEELGNPIDARARKWLEDSGYQTGHHTVHRITAEDIDEIDSLPF